jgi:hypothetical protein
MIRRWKRTFCSHVIVGVVACALAPLAAASEPGMAAADEVSEASYRDFLDNWLFTHAGDNRGFGLEHDLARGNIETLFLIWGLDVALEPFLYGGNTYYNVVATMQGSTYPDQEYIIGAHFDSVNNPGADDNASGTALVLEAARILSQYQSDYTIRFIAFDREEQGLIGSYAYVNDHAGDDILGMISTDMVAYNIGTNTATVHGGSGSTGLRSALDAAIGKYGDGLGSVQAGSSGNSDHWPFESAGYPACLLIEDWGNPNYHTLQDNVDEPGYLDYAFATRITRSAVGLLVDLAGVDVRLDTLGFSFPNGRPQHVDPDGGSTVLVEIFGVGSEVPQPDSGLLHYDIGNGWQTAPMTFVAGDLFEAVFPWSTCPDEILYYFSAESVSGGMYTVPRDAPSGRFSVLAAYGQVADMSDDFEIDLGWTVENVGATSGDWQRGVPVDDPSWAYDPASDGDGSGQCYLTQNEAGNTDVDNGTVRLVTPMLDMSVDGLSIAYEYYLFLDNSNGIDALLVEMSSNGDAGPWIEITRHDTNGGTVWHHHEITPEDISAAGVVLTDTMKMRFAARDVAADNIVEAGVDGFRIYRLDCQDPCPSDVDGSGVVDTIDFFALIAAWGEPGGPADVDGNGVVDVTDFFLLLADWGPCL